jgi:hypothetical protein
LSSWVDAAFQALAIDEERSSFGPTPWTSDPRADQHVEQMWFAGVHSDVGGGYPDPALAEIALLWMADRARECGLVLQADAFPASPENATQAPQDRMALRRSQPAWSAAPIPHGRLPPACATDPAARRKGPRPAPSRPAVRTRRVDRISRCRRSGSPGRAGPAPGTTSATAARHERDRANKPALVPSETTVGRMR